ncbi:MAG: YihY/virulence factor BrkB family protein [Polyangiales bacterium]
MMLVPHRSTRSRVMVWAKLLLESIDRSRMTGIAAELAFWLFLSLLPLAAVAGLVVARLAMHDVESTSALLASLPPGTRDLLTKELARVSAWNGGAVAPIAALTFVWLASSGVQSVFDGLERVAQAKPRPWLKKRLIAIATCVGLSIGVALLGFLGAGMRLVEKFAGKLPFVDWVPDAVGSALRLAIAFAIAVGLVSGLYTVALPKSVRGHTPLVPGAIAAVLAQGVLGFGYGAYIHHAGDGGAYQAGLAVIGVTLMALYLLSIALLVGVEINVLVAGRRVLRGPVHQAVFARPTTDQMVRCDRPIERRPGRAGLRPSLSGVS